VVSTPSPTPTATSTSGHPLPSGYLHTQGAQIVDANNNPVRLAGVNWYGFDCNSYVAGGLDHQPLSYICQKIANIGFNVIRLPFSVDVVQNNPTVTQYLNANPSLSGLTALQIMDKLIQTAGSYGLKVILDNHRSEAGWSEESNGLWYTQSYPESVWISSWQTIVQRYATNSTVIGCDLRNEPGAPPPDSTAWPQNNGSEWGYSDPAYNTTTYPDNWATAAQKAGNAILSINSNLLIFVEGVRYDPAGPIFNGSNYLYWPGGNLMGVNNAGGYRLTPVSVNLSVANRLVYSIHDYGPDAYSGLAWCQLDSNGNGTGATASACNSVWDQTWGYIAKNGIAPIWVGEFGTVNGYKPNDSTPRQDYTDINPDYVAQGYWFTYLVNYIKNNNLNWCYWAVNGTQSLAPGRDPSTADWYGVLDPTWSAAASQPMMTKLQSM
jgi:endoglucanase